MKKRKTDASWQEIFDQSTPREREEITLLLLAYIEKRKEITNNPFPLTDKTWANFPWLLRKRLLAYTVFFDVKLKLKASMPKHNALLTNLMLLVVGAFEYARFEYLKHKKN